jgi:hypothetical protein
MKSRGMGAFSGYKLEKEENAKLELFKFLRVADDAGNLRSKHGGNCRRNSENSGGYCCGYTSWVYHRQCLDPASPGGPQTVMRHVAHRAAQLLLIMKEEVQPRISKPDPYRHRSNPDPWRPMRNPDPVRRVWKADP